MAKNLTKVAFIYDFDETLSTTYMQDYILIPALGDRPDHFWKTANQWSKDNCADQITGTMYYIQHSAKEKGIKLTKQFLCDTAKNITYFDGVEQWFDRINEYGAKLGLQVEHYIISSGMEEIISGTSIRKHFKDVFGCSYVYNDEGIPIWPARIVNYSTKTQYIAKINKGLSKTEDRAVNEYMPDDQRRIPYKRMIYFGDGITDIPCMTFVKKQGGVSIALYPKGKKNKVTNLLLDNRVNYICSADYQEGSDLDSLVKCIIQEMKLSHTLQLKQKQQRSRESKKIETK